MSSLTYNSQVDNLGQARREFQGQRVDLEMKERIRETEEEIRDAETEKYLLKRASFPRSR